jgi:hypothetical protein
MKRAAAEHYLKYLSSHVRPDQIKRKSPAYMAYRGLINAKALVELFEKDLEVVADYFEELRPFYEHDFLFWLQYAIVCVERDELDGAENKINQSLAIRSASDGNFQAMNQKAIIYLLQAARNPASEASAEKAAVAIGILEEQIRTRGEMESHPYGSYCHYVAKWYCVSGASDQAWERLRKFAESARRQWPTENAVSAAVKFVEQEYLRRIVRRD